MAQCVEEYPPELMNDVNDYVGETINVYTEVGLQAGILLMLDLMKNTGKWEEFKPQIK